MRLPFSPENSPKPIRITALCLTGLFWAGGLGFLLRTLLENPHIPALNLLFIILFFGVLGYLAALAVLWMWQLLGNAASKFSQNTADQLFRSRGFTTELAETFRAAPYPKDEDVVICAYLLTAAEHYKEAETALAEIDRTALSRRSLALLNTTLLRIYFMTGRQEKVGRHLANIKERSEAAYEMKPEVLEEYKPYLDDAFDYELLNAVYATQKDDHETADRYMKRAMFRITLRDEADRELYPLIADLSLLYAQGKYPEAHQLEQRLQGEIANFSVPLSQPHKDELLRRIGQASVFVPVFDLKAKAELENMPDPAAGTAAVSGTERRLPTADELQQTPRPEDNGLELF